jgi:hypothetical protein
MIRKIAAIGFLIVFCISAQGDELDDDAIFERFELYTKQTYITHQSDIADTVLSDHIVGARVRGYALGNLLQYARRGKKNHKTWLMLEQKTKMKIFAEIEQEGKLRGRDRATIEKRKQKAWQQCMAAQQGWLDGKMIVLTKVDPKNAPNFFEKLRRGDSADDNPDAQDDSHFEKPDKRDFSSLVASDIMVKAHEIGSGYFLSYDLGTSDHRASAEFKSSDEKIVLEVSVNKIKDSETYQKLIKNYHSEMRDYPRRTSYEAERLNIGEATYIRKIGRAAFDADSYSGQLWAFSIRGIYKLSTSDYDSRKKEDEENSPKVRQAIINAITAMFNRGTEE